MLFQTPWTVDRIFRLLLGIAVIAGLVALVARLSDALIPFGLAFLLAYILNPLVNLLQHKLRSRLFAVILVLLAGILLLGGGLILLVAPIKAQATHAATLLQRAAEDAGFTQMISQRISPVISDWLRSALQQDQVAALLRNQDIWHLLGTAVSHIAPNAFSLLSGTLRSLVGLLGFSLVFMYLFFMLLDYQRLRNDFSKLLPAPYYEETFAFLQLFDHYMSGYFRAQALVSLILGGLFAIGFSLIGLPLGILFGLLVGAMTMVPYLQAISLPVAALLALLQSVDQGGPFWQPMLLVLLVYLVAQLIQDFILVPRILGDFSGLSPVMILLSLSIWGSLLVLLGLIVAIPFTCLFLAYYRRLLQRISTSASSTQQGDSP